jgi:D-alanine-D-alanine ligase and related ATP-grasp enzymes
MNGTASMSVDQVKARFAGNPVAEHFVRAGDVQLACLAAAARVQQVPHAPVEERFGPEGVPTPMLRLDLPGRVAYCSKGRIFVGPPDAPFQSCRHLNGAAIRLAGHKPATKLVLETLGFPTPAGREFDAGEEDEAVAWFQASGGPVCVKPLTGSLGEQVFPGIEEAGQLRAAFQAVAAYGGRVLVEEHVRFPHLAGNTPDRATFRFFFIKPVVMGVRMDLPANVVGDGSSSVRRLLDRKNADKLLRTGQPAVPLDGGVRETLRRQGISADDVPAAGRRVFLRDVSNSSQSGDTFTFPEGMHPSYAREIETLCNLIHGLHVAAVDTIIGDHTAPSSAGGYKIIEMNSSPGMIHFHFPWQGEPQDIAAGIVAILRLGEGWRAAMAAA